MSPRGELVLCAHTCRSWWGVADRPGHRGNLTGALSRSSRTSRTKTTALRSPWQSESSGYPENVAFFSHRKNSRRERFQAVKCTKSPGTWRLFGVVGMWFPVFPTSATDLWIEPPELSKGWSLILRDETFSESARTVGGAWSSECFHPNEWMKGIL